MHLWSSTFLRYLLSIFRTKSYFQWPWKPKVHKLLFNSKVDQMHEIQRHIADAVKWKFCKRRCALIVFWVSQAMKWLIGLQLGKTSSLVSTFCPVLGSFETHVHASQHMRTSVAHRKVSKWASVLSTWPQFSCSAQWSIFARPTSPTVYSPSIPFCTFKHLPGLPA